MDSKAAAVLAIGLLLVAPAAHGQPMTGADVVLSIELCFEGEIRINVLNSVEFAGFQFAITEADGVSPIGIDSTSGGIAEEAGTFVNSGATSGIVLGASFSPQAVIGPSSEPRLLLKMQLAGPITNGPPQIQDLVVSTFTADIVSSSAAPEIDECSLSPCANPQATFGNGITCDNTGAACSLPQGLENCPQCMECLPGPSAPAPEPVPNDQPTATVKSDPHFVGLKGQSYDFHGRSGNIYCLINDKNLVINAAFSQAWETGVDGDVVLLERNVRARQGATWISELGFLIKDIQVSVSVHRNAMFESFCPFSLAESVRDSVCFKGGSIEANGQPIYKPGKYGLTSGLASAGKEPKAAHPQRSKAYSIELRNYRSFGRVAISGRMLDAFVDYIPPLPEWEVLGEVDSYSHLNLQINRIMVTSEAHGVLGQTVRDSSGQDPAQIVEGSDDDYVVGGLFDSVGFFKNIFQGPA